jgi:hypothetical protein
LRDNKSSTIEIPAEREGRKASNRRTTATPFVSKGGLMSEYEPDNRHQPDEMAGTLR